MESGTLKAKTKWSKGRFLAYAIGAYILLGLLLSLACGGTLHNDWKAAIARTVEDPCIIGMIYNDGPSASSQTLVLEYSLFPYNHSWGPDLSKLQVPVPMRNGKAIAPLGYEGSINEEVPWNKMEPENQARAVASYCFSHESINYVREMIGKNRMIPVNNAKSCYSSFGVQESVKLNSELETTWGNIIPYWFSYPVLDTSMVISSTGNDLYNYGFSDIFANPSPLRPPDGWLVVPSQLPRPPGDKRKALASALMKTPIDICIDTVMTPIYFAYFSFFRLTGNIWW